MGILRCDEGEAVDGLAPAGAASVLAREREFFIWTPPGTAAASRPPPVAARNCLRSTDLLTRELRIPTPPKWPCRPGEITARGIIRLLSRGGSHKIVLVGTKRQESGRKKVSRKNRMPEAAPRRREPAGYGTCEAQRKRCRPLGYMARRAAIIVD